MFASATCGDCPGCDLIYPRIKLAAYDITDELKSAEDRIADNFAKDVLLKQTLRPLEKEIAKVKRRIQILQINSLRQQKKILYLLNRLSYKEIIK
jgi:hypothetical protein